MDLYKNHPENKYWLFNLIAFLCSLVLVEIKSFKFWLGFILIWICGGIVASMFFTAYKLYICKKSKFISPNKSQAPFSIKAL